MRIILEAESFLRRLEEILLFSDKPVRHSWEDYNQFHLESCKLAEIAKTQVKEIITKIQEIAQEEVKL